MSRIEPVHRTFSGLCEPRFFSSVVSVVTTYWGYNELGPNHSGLNPNSGMYGSLGLCPKPPFYSSVLFVCETEKRKLPSRPVRAQWD